MGYICDGCYQFISREPIETTAKDWNSEVCDNIIDCFGNCYKYECRYNIDGNLCVSFYICSKCKRNKKIMNGIFKDFTH